MRAEYDAQLPPAGPRVLAAERVVRMIDIVHEALARASEKREVAHHLVLDQRAADGAFEAELVVVTGGEPYAGVERVGRLPGDDVDRAADGVAPVERSLRPPAGPQRVRRS